MTWVSRRVLVPLVSVALASPLIACSNSSANGAVGTSGASDALVHVDTTSGPMVVVENRTDQPLVDVSVALKAGILTFSDTITRLEAKERRQLRHGDFSSRDGTSFNLRVARPKSVVITGRDLNGKQFETAVPWE
jgi:hypothetical protein